MSLGSLSRYVVGVATKTLTAVEIDASRSNQHEIQGVLALRELFGVERSTIAAQFTYFGEDESETESRAGRLTWYNAREHNPSRSPEYHLYYSSDSDPVWHRARPGDLLVVALLVGGRSVVCIAPAGSTAANRLRWLFESRPSASAGGTDLSADAARARRPEEQAALPGFAVTRFEGPSDLEVGPVEATILEQVGVVPEVDARGQVLDRLIARFGSEFPSTSEFAAFARQEVDTDAVADPDGAIMQWVAREDVHFRALETHIVAPRLAAGFATLDDFIEYSLSVQNRRKARMGHGFMHHLTAVFAAHGLQFEREVETEPNSKVDFLFPGARAYRDEKFPVARISMLAAKSRLKERWRQVLDEAARLQDRHLATLEPGISTSQTDSMRSKLITLVMPASVRDTYQLSQRNQALTLREFIERVRAQQAST